ncbi:methionine biosynthesis PLP-dependent protein [Salipaludibacillus sp. CUR1]|uniref:methionine biosynthesis PLP-dependent protein n=1 Tax=Salipaludibacillus sp. CUR1 TaxID=2820003 RepID=UPI001E5FBF07|nr:methionine biosynthesis PLP-dependent protein [Salipaludibacillus sp. CUR1]MCE7794046.1 methionine biosynthesis PLP-dependent protein [Salipaludibacillus sp. CUR1]
MSKYRKELETVLVQIGNRSESATGAVSAPIYFSTAYRHEGIGQSTGYDYSRTGNPTRELLEEAIAKLEGGDRGFACSSGMSAVQVVLSLFRSGDEILASSDLYGGTYRLFEEGWTRWGLSFKYGDAADIQFFKDNISENTKALFIETPTNPLMHEADIKAFSDLAKEHGLLLIVDNTFYTPLLQRPILEGADIVIHSASKYLSGHNDVIAGLVVSKGEELSERIFYNFNSMGPILSPLDSWLVIRGLKTLTLRMEKHEQNAQEVSGFLKDHPAVQDVIYPGRGGMLSFRVKDESWVNPILQKLNLITFAESLGGVESLMTYPATQTHADVPEEVRNKLGVCNKLLRFSVGIEAADDLIEDLNQALNDASGVNGGKE